MAIEHGTTLNLITLRQHQYLESGHTTKQSEIFSQKSIKGKEKSRDRYKGYGPHEDEDNSRSSMNEHIQEEAVNPLDR